MESEWPFKGIVVGDAYKELHEGIEGTMETQLRKLCQLLEREVGTLFEAMNSFSVGPSTFSNFSFLYGQFFDQFLRSEVQFQLSLNLASLGTSSVFSGPSLTTRTGFGSGRGVPCLPINSPTPFHNGLIVSQLARLTRERLCCLFPEILDAFPYFPTVFLSRHR